MHKEEERGILLDKKSALLKGVPRPLKYKLRSWKGHLSETCNIETDTCVHNTDYIKLIVLFEHATGASTVNTKNETSHPTVNQ